MAYNQLQKLRDNIRAIRIALDFRDGITPQAEDQAALQAYSGFGGLKAVLFPAGDKQEWIDRNASQNDLKLYPSMMELHELLKDGLNEADYKTAVQSIRDSILIGIVKTKDNPDHESLVLVTAKHRDSKQYFYANFSELNFSANWINGGLLSHELDGLVAALQQYNHDFYFSGDQSLKEHFNFGQNAEVYFRALNAFHQDGSLVTLNGQVGHLQKINETRTQAVFQALADQKDARLYERYTLIRDTYLALYEIESLTQIAYPNFRNDLNIAYNEFVRQYGELNRPANRRLILTDEKEGFKVLSSVERKEGNDFKLADNQYSHLNIYNILK